MTQISKAGNKYFLGSLIPNARFYTSKIDEIITRLNTIVTTIGTLRANTISEYDSNQGVTVDGVLIKDGTVTQISTSVSQLTNIGTTVVANTNTGIITTQAASAAALAKHTFTVTCSKAVPGAGVLVSINDYSGTYDTNGIPVITTTPNGAGGSFDINIINVHGTNALNGTLLISFQIIAP